MAKEILTNPAHSADAPLLPMINSGSVRHGSAARSVIRARRAQPVSNPYKFNPRSARQQSGIPG
jgi:hypothetical protein